MLINSCWYTLLNNPLLKYSQYFKPNKVSIHFTILYHHANLQTNGKESSEENPSIIKEHIFALSDDNKQDYHFVHHLPDLTLHYVREENHLTGENELVPHDRQEHELAIEEDAELTALQPPAEKTQTSELIRDKIINGAKPLDLMQEFPGSTPLINNCCHCIPESMCRPYVHIFMEALE